MNRKTLFLLFLLLLPLAGQEPPGKEIRPHVRVTGEASVSAKPDQAEINIGVATQAPGADEAAAQNARQTSVVIASLRDILGQAGDIKTLNYSLAPLQRYPKEGGSPVITGYSATNTVHVRTQNLSVVGKLVDTVTKSGANQINGIRFTLRDDRTVRSQALREAAQNARAAGDAVASALGVHIVRVISAETSQPVTVRPYEMAATARLAAAPTPVEPGSVDVHAIVILTLEVAP